MIVINVTSQQPLKLDQFDLEQPVMLVPKDQLGDVEQLLQRHNIRFSTRGNLVSLNRGPFLATIIFDEGADRKLIQSVLDSAK